MMRRWTRELRRWLRECFPQPAAAAAYQPRHLAVELPCMQSGSYYQASDEFPSEAERLYEPEPDTLTWMITTDHRARLEDERTLLRGFAPRLYADNWLDSSLEEFGRWMEDEDAKRFEFLAEMGLAA